MRVRRWQNVTVLVLGMGATSSIESRTDIARGRTTQPKHDVQNHLKKHSGETNRIRCRMRIKPGRRRRMLEVPTSESSQTPPRPQRPRSTGIPATLPSSLSNLHSIFLLFLLLHLSPPSPLLLGLLYFPVAPLLPSSPRTPPNQPTATRTSAAACLVILPVVTPPAAGIHFHLLMMVFFIELCRWVPCNLIYRPR